MSSKRSRGLALGFALAARLHPTAGQGAEPSGGFDAGLARAGLVFVAQQALQAPAQGPLYFSMGQILSGLEHPVGSCRLTFRGEIPAGTRLTVASVGRTRSPHEDRGISSVTFRFQNGNRAQSLFCDTVGNEGPALGEVMTETQGVFQVDTSGIAR